MKTPLIYDKRLWEHLRPLGEVPGAHVPRSRTASTGLRAQADELPGAHARVRKPAAELPRAAAALRRGVRRSTATSSPGRSTASPACATSPRTTRTSSARASRSRTRSSAASTSPPTSTSCSAWSAGSSSRPDPRTSSAPTRSGTSRRARCARRSTAAGSSTTLNEGDGAFYGPKIDLHMTDVARAVVADGHDPARCADAAAVRSHLHGRRQHGAHAVRRSTVRCFGSLERFIGILIEHYARRLSALARAGAGANPPRRRDAPRRRCGARRPGCGRPASRVEVDDRDETIGRRIRDAELEKIPRVVVYGDRESADALAVRERGGRAGRRSRWTNSWPNWVQCEPAQAGTPVPHLAGRVALETCPRRGSTELG